MFCEAEAVGMMWTTFWARHSCCSMKSLLSRGYCRSGRHIGHLNRILPPSMMALAPTPTSLEYSETPLMPVWFGLPIAAKTCFNVCLEFWKLFLVVCLLAVLDKMCAWVVIAGSGTDDFPLSCVCCTVGSCFWRAHWNGKSVVWRIAAVVPSTIIAIRIVCRQEIVCLSLVSVSGRPQDPKRRVASCELRKE